jgi:hypothetical protein
MPITQSPKVLAFIEGTMEKLFVNNNFHYVQVIPLSNGSGWTTQSICKQICTLFAAKNMNADQIIVWIDKEKQSCSAAEFAAAIRSALVAEGAEHDKIFICVPDRMTENIILSDEEIIHAEFEDPNYVYKDNGFNGKYILSEMFKKKGVNYKETFHGVNMLKKIRLSRCAKNNLSVQNFMNGMSVPCWGF